jgi:hypothetical protein
MDRFHPEVEQYLRTAGWYPGREVPDATIDAWAAACEPTAGPMPPWARQIFVEFGGLTIGDRGAPGEAHARGVIEFDPRTAIGEEDRAEPIGAAYPLGDTDKGHAVSYVAADGSIWVWTLDDVLREVGLTIEEGLDRWLLGRPEICSIVDAGLRPPASDVPQR